MLVELLKNRILELQIPSGIAQRRLQEFCHNGTTGMPGERYFLGRISFHGAGIIPSLKGLSYFVASLCLWLRFVKKYGRR